MLFVDDEIINLKGYEINFRKNSDIIIAKNGIEALKIVEETENIKLVFTDMKMPGMDGLEFIREARKVKPDISYYILTGYSISGPIAEALNEGLVKKCFSKPVNIQKIRDEIDSLS